MSTAHADAWHESGIRAERPAPRRTAPPPLPPLPEIAGRARPVRPVAAEARGRSPEHGSPERRRPSDRRAERARDDLPRSRPTAARRPADPQRERGPARDDRRAGDDARPGRPGADRAGSRRPPVGERPAPQQGSRLRGSVAVLGVFLTTLAGGAVDSFLGSGLGMVTLVALVASTAIATLLVRRRDLFTVVLSPPLVFVAVTGVNIALGSANLTLATIATLLIRGFPTMAVATGAAIVLAVVRLVTRR
jgi:hypothetical protein